MQKALIIIRFYFFLNEDNSIFNKIIKFFIVFYLPPVILIFLFYIHNLLIIEGEKIGMFEDILFISFSFFIAPFSLLLLHLVLRRFSFFISDIFSFTKKSEKEKCSKIADKYIDYLKNAKIYYWSSCIIYKSK